MEEITKNTSLEDKLRKTAKETNEKYTEYYDKVREFNMSVSKHNASNKKYYQLKRLQLIEALAKHFRKEYEKDMNSTSSNYTLERLMDPNQIPSVILKLHTTEYARNLYGDEIADLIKEILEFKRMRW